MLTARRRARGAHGSITTAPTLQPPHIFFTSYPQRMRAKKISQTKPGKISHYLLAKREQTQESAREHAVLPASTATAAAPAPTPAATATAFHWLFRPNGPVWKIRTVSLF